MADHMDMCHSRHTIARHGLTIGMACWDSQLMYHLDFPQLNELLHGALIMTWNGDVYAVRMEPDGNNTHARASSGEATVAIGDNGTTTMSWLNNHAAGIIPGATVAGSTFMGHEATIIPSNDENTHTMRSFSVMGADGLAQGATPPDAIPTAAWTTWKSRVVESMFTDPANLPRLRTTHGTLTDQLQQDDPVRHVLQASAHAQDGRFYASDIAELACALAGTTSKARDISIALGTILQHNTGEELDVTDTPSLNTTVSLELNRW